MAKAHAALDLDPIYTGIALARLFMIWQNYCWNFLSEEDAFQCMVKLIIGRGVSQRGVVENPVGITSGRLRFSSEINLL